MFLFFARLCYNIDVETGYSTSQEEGVTMKQTIITISREFGSGGHFIGEEVSKRLGIPFYDKNIIQQIAEKTGFSEDFVKEQSEYAPSKNMFAYAFVGRDHTGSSLSDQVYAAQTQVIRNLSEKGSCIIIGRCADYILKDRPDTYHIFVYGDEYEKISRTQQLFNLSEKDARAMNRDMDKKRRLHYEYYTDRKWMCIVFSNFKKLIDKSFKTLCFVQRDLYILFLLDRKSTRLNSSHT